MAHDAHAPDTLNWFVVSVVASGLMLAGVGLVALFLGPALTVKGLDIRWANDADPWWHYVCGAALIAAPMCVLLYLLAQQASTRIDERGITQWRLFLQNKSIFWKDVTLAGIESWAVVVRSESQEIRVPPLLFRDSKSLVSAIRGHCEDMADGQST